MNDNFISLFDLNKIVNDTSRFLKDENNSNKDFNTWLRKTNSLNGSNIGKQQLDGFVNINSVSVINDYINNYYSYQYNAFKHYFPEKKYNHFVSQNEVLQLISIFLVKIDQKINEKNINYESNIDYIYNSVNKLSIFFNKHYYETNEILKNNINKYEGIFNLILIYINDKIDYLTLKEVNELLNNKIKNENDLDLFKQNIKKYIIKNQEKLYKKYVFFINQKLNNYEIINLNYLLNILNELLSTKGNIHNIIKELSENFSTLLLIIMGTNNKDINLLISDFLNILKIIIQENNESTLYDNVLKFYEYLLKIYTIIFLPKTNPLPSTLYSNLNSLKLSKLTYLSNKLINCLNNISNTFKFNFSFLENSTKWITNNILLYDKFNNTISFLYKKNGDIFNEGVNSVKKSNTLFNCYLALTKGANEAILFNQKELVVNNTKINFGKHLKRIGNFLKDSFNNTWDVINNLNTIKDFCTIDNWLDVIAFTTNQILNIAELIPGPVSLVTTIFRGILNSTQTFLWCKQHNVSFEKWQEAHWSYCGNDIFNNISDAYKNLGSDLGIALTPILAIYDSISWVFIKLDFLSWFHDCILVLQKVYE